MSQLNHSADSPLGALASSYPAQLAHVQERCRKYGDGMEIPVHCVQKVIMPVRSAFSPAATLAMYASVYSATH